MSAIDQQKNNYNLFIKDAYYQVNPDHILGEAYQESSRYGLITRYRGDIGQALRDITSTCPNYEIKATTTTSVKNTTITLGSVLSLQQRKNAEAAVKQSMPSLIARVQAKQRARNENEEILTFDDIDAMYNSHLTDAQKCAFVFYMKSVLERKMLGGWQKYDMDVRALRGEIDKAATIQQYVADGVLCYDGEGYSPAFIFASGDVFTRKEKVEGNKAVIIGRHGEMAYERQLEILNNATSKTQANRLRLDAEDKNSRLRIIVSDAIAKEYQVKMLEDGKPFTGRVSRRSADAGRIDFKSSARGWHQFESLSLQEAFIYWLKEYTGIPIRQGVSWRDILEFAVEMRSRSPKEDATDFQRKKKIVLTEAQRLFALFLSNIITQEDRTNLELDWNRTYQGDLPVDYSQVPIGFPVAKFYNGFAMDIRDEKREAVAAAMIQGSLCISYGVGLGKTWCAIFAMAQFIENGWANRPLLAVPKQVYPQFIREIQGILPYIKINEFGNLSNSYSGNLDTGIDGKLHEKSISIATFQGMKRIGLSEQVNDTLLSRIDNILNQEDKDISTYQRVSNEKKNEGFLGRIIRDTVVNADTLGIDMIVLDEAHAAKKIFTSVKGEAPEDGKRVRTKYEINSGEPSAMGIKTFALCQYVQSISSGNILLLTATPFTNSPLEVFSMLALLAYDTLLQRKISNLNNFFDKFVEVENQLVVNAQLGFDFRDVFTGFADLQGLQTLIRRYFLYKQSTKTLERPDKWVMPFKEEQIDGLIIRGGGDNTTLPLTEIQTAMLKLATTYADASTKAIRRFADEYKNSRLFGNIQAVFADFLSQASLVDFPVRLLQCVGMSRALALSPYLFTHKNWFKLPNLNYKNYVEQSPKLQYTMKCIASVKEAHEAKGEPVSGQIIYMNVGVEYFTFIKEYLVEEIGFDAREIGIIEGTMPTMEDKAVVQDKFLGRKFNARTNEYESIPDKYRIKVLIGSSSITEGINLQTHCTVIYNLYLAWNPTDIIQLEGRGWRQGNLYKNIRVVYPLMENSIDSFMFQKQGEKAQRINQIWDFDGNVATIDLTEFNPSELKYQLITDPARVAFLEASEKAAIKRESILVLQTDKSQFEKAKTQMANAIDFSQRFYERLSVLNQILERWKISDASRIALPTKEEFAALKLDVAELSKWVLRQKKKYLESLDELNVERKKAQNNYQLYSTGYFNNMPESINWAGISFNEQLSNIQNFERFCNRVLLPRKIEPTTAAFDNVIKHISEEIAALEKQNPMDTEILNERAKEIENERLNRRTISVTVDERVKEFSKLNYLLFEKRMVSNNCSFGKGTSVIKYAIGDSVKVRQDDDTNKAAKIIAIAERVHCSPMYRIQYSGGYQNMAFESDFVNTKEIAFVEKLYLNSQKRQQQIYELLQSKRFSK